MKVIVFGGAGYIGSHTCKSLFQNGIVPVTVDNLVSGYKKNVQWGPFYQADIHDEVRILEILKAEKVTTAIHFASSINVSESVSDPLKYYDNNFIGSFNLFRALVAGGVKNIIFSSSCSVYGNPAKVPITEDCPTSPSNPYGNTKLATENLLMDLANAADLNFISLRYFNACGADSTNQIGEEHEPETHLIPLAIKASTDANYTLSVFGDDYPTSDGSCIRDYIHVEDLASAHTKAAQLMISNKNKVREFINLGSGKGLSVFEIITQISALSKNRVKFQVMPRRPGDPAKLIADNSKARQLLNWHPEKSNIETIIRTALNWHLKNS